MSNEQGALPPCPFCGGEGLPEKELRAGYENCKDDEDAYAYFIRCRSCAATGGWAKSSSGAERWWRMRSAAHAGEPSQETVPATLYDAAMTALLTLQLDVVRLVDEAREKRTEQVARWLDWAGEKRWVPEYCAKRLRDGSWLPDLAAPDSVGDAGTGEP